MSLDPPITLVLFTDNLIPLTSSSIPHPQMVVFSDLQPMYRVYHQFELPIFGVRISGQLSKMICLF